MKKAIKAALLSGLIFPGAGHCSLKRFKRGLVFFIPAILSMVFLIQHTVNQALGIVEQIEQGTVPLDAEAISKLIAAPPPDTTLLLMNIATWVLVACWAGAIVDSYRLGHIADQETPPNS
jgi:hypothetical protein